MAGRGTLKPVPTRAAYKEATKGLRYHQKTRASVKKRSNSMLLGEALDIAKTYDISIVKGNSVVDVLQTVLDRLMDKWRWVCKQADALELDNVLVERVDAEGNRLVEPNIWLQYEQSLRSELTELGIRMGHLGVDERRVRVQEAQVELLGRAVLAAAHAIGLPLTTQKELGAALRTELERLDDPAGAPNPAMRQNGPGRSDDKHPVIEGTAQEVK